MNGLPHATRADALIQAYLDGALSDTQEQELRSWLAENPEHMREFVSQIQLDLALCDLCEADSQSRQSNSLPPTRLPARSIFRSLAAPLAMAASLALVVGGWWLAQSRQPAGLGLRVAEVAGEANIQHSTSNIQHPSGEGKQVKAVVGMELRQGDRVVVAAGGKVGLKYDREETTIGLEGATAGFGAEMGGKRVKLEAGRFVCTAAPQAKPFRIQSPHALSTVVGTRFNIEVFDAKTALTVSEGKVQIERDGQSLLVESNQIAEASDEGLKMLPPPAPRTLAGTVIRKVGLPIEAYGLDGIAFDGSVLWGCMTSMTGDRSDGRSVSKLYKLDPVSGKLLGTEDVSASVQLARGLDWDGVKLWIGDYDGHKVVAVDPATGRAVKTLHLPSDFWVQGVAVDDGCLWVGGGQSQGVGKSGLWSVRKLDLSSGALVAAWPLPTEVREAQGLEYFNGALWAANGEKGAMGKVFKLNPTDGTVLGSFAAPEGDRIRDLAKSGTAGQLWIYGQHGGVYLVEVGE